MESNNQTLAMTFTGELVSQDTKNKTCRAIFYMIATLDGKEVMRIPFELKEVSGTEYDQLIDVKNNCLYPEQIKAVAKDKFKSGMEAVSQFCKDAGLQYNNVTGI